jgi:hypothetical protein
MMQYRVHTIAIPLLFFAVSIASGQSIEWSIKGGVGGSYTTMLSDGSNTRWFGEPSEERFDPVGAVTIRIPLGQSVFYAGAEPGLTLMGTSKTGYPFGSDAEQFRSSMLFLTSPVFIGVRARSWIVNPYLAVGMGPHILLHRERTEAFSSEIATGFDKYRRITAATFVDTGFRLAAKRPLEFGLQWQRTVPHGYKSASGLTLHTVNAQVYFRVVL